MMREDIDDRIKLSQLYYGLAQSSRELLGARKSDDDETMISLSTDTENYISAFQNMAQMQAESTQVYIDRITQADPGLQNRPSIEELIRDLEEEFDTQQTFTPAQIDITSHEQPIHLDTAAMVIKQQVLESKVFESHQFNRQAMVHQGLVEGGVQNMDTGMNEAIPLSNFKSMTMSMKKKGPKLPTPADVAFQKANQDKNALAVIRPVSNTVGLALNPHLT